MGTALFDLSGKTAVVAGGTSGIGRTLALGLADAGADVVVVGRREDAVYEVAAAVEARGRRTLRLTADVTERASLERVRDACLQTFGHVNVLVAAAGVSARVSTLAMDDGDWRRIIDTNLTGTLHACQVFGAGMVERGAGRIITVASLSSFLGFSQVAASRARSRSSGRRTA
jgi:NAD(P)-dependent dehydrogenase (short-subunit alcohol dehydrogenase family)